MSSHGLPIQHGPPPLRPGYRWETRAERTARESELPAYPDAFAALRGEAEAETAPTMPRHP